MQCGISFCPSPALTWQLTHILKLHYTNYVCSIWYRISYTKPWLLIYIIASKTSWNSITVLNNIVQHILVSGVSRIHDTTSERVCQLHVPMDCWFVAFENVDYRTACKQTVFCYTDTFKVIINAWRKHRFTSGINDCVECFMTICTEGDHHIWQMTKASCICAVLFQVTEQRIFVKYQRKCKYQLVAFFAKFCQHIVTKKLTFEHNGTCMTLAEGLFTMANQDDDFLTIIIIGDNICF
jgi:hypothetical protein